jgi:hypothetical protein
VSRYLVDKFLYQVDRNEAWVAAYRTDPAAFVEQWEANQASKLFEGEYTTAHRFTDEERTALKERDVERLYVMGAHPFILWTLMLPILEKDFPSFPALVQAYNARIQPHGRPDFRT